MSAYAQRVANMSDLTPQQKSDVTDLTLTGRLTLVGNSDFRQMRDLCWQLCSVDLSQSDCEFVPNNAFHSRHRLEQVELPVHVRKIGSQAFFACDNLRSILLPEAVDTIGVSAFSRCSSLRSLTIAGTPYIGAFAFQGCSSLRLITLLSRIPPECDVTTFESIDRRKCRLSVPRGCKAVYSQSPGWRHFFIEEQTSWNVCDPASTLIPVPAELDVRVNEQLLKVKLPWTIDSAAGLENEVSFATQMLKKRTLQRIKVCTHSRRRVRGNKLKLVLDTKVKGQEAYELKIGHNEISILASTPVGIFRGLTTLEQLLVGDAQQLCCDYIPALNIKDAPRTQIRELMVDPARIFIPFDELMAFIPEMARYKYNALHLHLVDDQAWRIEIKKYPELIKKSSSRIGMDDMLMPISGYYTQEQMKQLVAYASKYYIQIIPEIEMPGHEVAAIHAFPQLTCGAKEIPLILNCTQVNNDLLCPGEEFVYEFLENIFDELAEVFPSPYVHLGGDEAGRPALSSWTDCVKCCSLKKRLGITTTDCSENWRLQKYLFDRVINYLRQKHNKIPMYWWETDFKEVQEGCVTFAWRHGLTNEAIESAIQNRVKIMLCPGEYCYFDYPMRKGDMPEVNWGMPINTLEQVYALNPSWGRDKSFEEENLLGVAGTLWSECINSPERIYYQAYPRALALAEAGWSLQARRSYPSFLRRLFPILRDMQRRGISFSHQFSPV